MIWGALLLMACLGWAGLVAWYGSWRQLAATTGQQQRRLLHQVFASSASVGVGILLVGVIVFVKTGYNWLVLALAWAVGLLHLGLLGLRAALIRKARKRGVR